MPLRMNAKGPTAELLIYDDIGEWFGGISAKDVALELRALKKVDTINVRINSSGGIVSDGVAIHTTLKNHPARITVDIDGAAWSIASLIAMAGDEIRIAEGAFFMIHNPWSGLFGTAEDMRHEADVLDQIRDEIIGIYARRTENTTDAIGRMMDEETWLGPDDAMKYGFADSKSDHIAAAAHVSGRFNFKIPDHVKQQIDKQKNDLHERSQRLRSSFGWDK